jgi:subtilase family serine protease
LTRSSPLGPYWFDDLKQAYQYPSYLVSRGAGRTIGIISTSDFLNSDFQTYFAHEKLAPPVVIRRPVSGGPAKFDSNSGDSAEVTLDIQQAGGSAPGARLIVYGGPDDTDATFAAMYTAIDEDNSVDIVNTSFGSCELFYTPAYNGGVDFRGILRVFHQLFLQGNSQGITFFTSSGDWGAKDCWSPDLSTAVIGVNNLASDPAVTGVGGTNLVTSTIAGSLQSTYVRENAFLDPMAPGQGPFGASGNTWGSGGGKSVIWPKPVYQNLVDTHASSRALPDVSLHMGGCPVGAATPCGPDRSFDIAVFDGGFFGFIGTSLSSPDFAGLQAVQQQALGSGRQGNVNFMIYALAKGNNVGNGIVFRPNIAGNNGFPAVPGYDFVTGLGTVRGSQYAFKPFGPFAGLPQTPSNP